MEQKQASEIPGTLITDETVIALVLECVPKEAIDREFVDNGSEITGLIVRVRDGEYKEVWATDFSRPFDIRSVYQKLV